MVSVEFYQTFKEEIYKLQKIEKAGIPPISSWKASNILIPELDENITKQKTVNQNPSWTKMEKF